MRVIRAGVALVAEVLEYGEDRLREFEELLMSAPETEYPKLSSLSGCVAYLGTRVRAAA